MSTPSNATHYEGQDLEALAEIPNYQRWILSYFAPHLRGRVLEIGAGIGSIAKRYVQSVDELVLLEPALNLCSELKKKFTAHGHVRVFDKPLAQACADEKSEFAPGSFDAVLLVNVLEHVADDAGMLADIQRLLKPSGYLLLFVPAVPWLYGSLDALVSHERRYGLKQLEHVVTRQGFAIRELRYFDALGVVPWLIAGRVLKQTSFNARAATLYDSVAVPIGQKLEGLRAPPLGKNLLCIAQKPSR